jgi:hypothetical protein
MELTRAKILSWIDAFADELDEEGIDAAALTKGTEGPLERSQAVGHGVFRNWAQNAWVRVKSA